MQTCLMCWSVGALPWGRRKRKQFIHGTISSTRLNGKLTDRLGREQGGWVYNRTTCPHCPGADVWSSQAAPAPCAVRQSLHRATPGPALHSPEGPGSQAGQWRPVPPARLGVQAVLSVLPLQGAPDLLQAPSSQAPRGYPPTTRRHTRKPGLHTSNVAA